MIQNAKETSITGTEINYYEICHTKLWFFAHHIRMEQDSDLAALGKLTHEEYRTCDTSEANFQLARYETRSDFTGRVIQEVSKRPSERRCTYGSFE